MSQISIYKGDSRTLEVTVTDTSGAAVDITGYTMKFTVKKSEADTTNTIQKTTTLATEIDLTDPANGIAEVYLLPADTLNLKAGTYVYDVEVTTDTSKVYTVIKSTFVIVEDVTK